MSAPVTVLIADDHARTRASVREALEGTGEFTICAEAADRATAVNAAASCHPDVCLVDINMPGNGITAAREITAAAPDTAVVMLTISRDVSDLFEALRAGASGYLVKGVAFDRLRGLLRQILDGEAVLPGTLVNRLVAEFRDRETRTIAIGSGEEAHLTEREWAVLELMRQRLTTAEIATRLFISPTTVRSHVSALLQKLRVDDREAAIRLLRHR